MLWFDQWVHVNPRQQCRLSIRVFENLRRVMSNAHWAFLSRKSNCVLLIIKSVCKIRTSVPLLYWLCEMDGSPFGRGNSWSKMVTKYASLLWLTGEISSTNLVRYLFGNVCGDNHWKRFQRRIIQIDLKLGSWLVLDVNSFHKNQKSEMPQTLWSRSSSHFWFD